MKMGGGQGIKACDTSLDYMPDVVSQYEQAVLTIAFVYVQVAQHCRTELVGKCCSCFCRVWTRKGCLNISAASELRYCGRHCVS